MQDIMATPTVSAVHSGTLLYCLFMQDFLADGCKFPTTPVSAVHSDTLEQCRDTCEEVCHIRFTKFSDTKTLVVSCLLDCCKQD